MITPEKLAESVTEIFWALRRAAVGSCDCNAKNPDPDVHAERCDYKHIKNAERGLTRLQSDLSAAQSALPATYYADRPLPERVCLMVKDWQRAVVAIQQAEKRIEELERLLKKAHDAMFSWHSSEYANHPLSVEISHGLYETRSEK